MRIEISAGGLAGLCAVSEYQSSIDAFLSDAERVISCFQAVQTQTCQLSGGVGSLQEAVSLLEQRKRGEEEKLSRASRVRDESHDFLDLAIRVDQQVAGQVKRNQEAFYQVNPWLRPPAPAQEEAGSWLEQGWKWLCGAGEAIVQGVKQAWDHVTDTVSKAWNGLVDFYNEHKVLCRILIGAVAIVAAVVVTALTGGAAIPALVAMTKAALVAGLFGAAQGVLFSTVSSALKHESAEDTFQNMLEGGIDGFSSGFMFGAIFSAGKQIVSCFKNASSISQSISTASESSSEVQEIQSGGVNETAASRTASQKTPNQTGQQTNIKKEPKPYQKSEIKVSETAGDGFHDQVSIDRDTLQGAKYGAKNSIRIDTLKAEQNGIAQKLSSSTDYSKIDHFEVLEVKNFSIEKNTGRNNLFREILRQANERNAVLSKYGATVNQIYYVDTVEHNISIGDWMDLFEKLESHLPKNVDIFPMWK